MVTKEDRDRAHRLGVLAARTGRQGCPYRLAGSPDERQLAVIYVRALVRAGGDGGRAPAQRRGGPVSPKGGAFVHLGMPV